MKYKVLVTVPDGKIYETVYDEVTDENLDLVRKLLKSNPTYLTFVDMYGYECYFTKEMLGRCVIRLKVVNE